MTAPGTVQRFVVTTVAVASFGPYLVGSIRTEQAVVYGLTLVLLAPILIGFRMSGGGTRFFIPWIAYVTVATIGVIAPSRMPAPFAPGNALAGFDNLLLPVAIMLLIWGIVPDANARALLARFCKIVAVAMACNGAIAIASTQIDLAILLRPFWSGNEGTTVAGNAATMGRFSGILNQPAEAGGLYGIAGLAAIYAWQNRAVLVAGLLMLITVGGLISVSKVFIFGGLPAIAIYWFWSNRGGRKVASIFGVALIALGVVQSGILSQWTGLDYLGRLFTGDRSDLLYLYSAGRFDDGSTFVHVINSVMEYSPISGVGASGWKVAYDGAIAEALVTAGIIGAILVIVVTVALFTLPTLLRAGTDRVFALMFAITVVAASLGFAPLTANRVSTVAWVIIALLVGAGRHNQTLRRLEASLYSSEHYRKHVSSARGTRA